MNAFWAFARQMLHYRRLLAVGFGAALLDAASAFGGFAALLLVIDRFFGDGQPMRELAADWLAHDRLAAVLGDVTHWAQLIPASDFGGLAFVLGFVLCLAVFGATMRFVYQASMLTVVLRTVMRVRKRAYQQLIHAPLDVLWTQGTADHISRVVRDCTQLSKGMMALMGRAIRDILMGVAFLLLALIVDWGLTAMFLVAVAAIYFCVRKFGKRIRKASRRAFRAFGYMTGAMQEALQGAAAVKVHNAEGYERRRFNTINRQVLKQELRARTVRALSSPVTELIAITGVIAISLIAAYIVLAPDSTRQPADLVKVLLPLALAGNSVRPLARLNNTLQESAAAAERVAEVLMLPTEPNARHRRREERARPTLPRHRRSVRFENVTYRYPEQPEAALREVSLAVSFEQTVAIVGPNGSGKSTLLSLLPRLIEPASGRVLIDDVDIATVSLRSLRAQMALVSQQTVLFGGTIAENIAYGLRHATREAIEAAARQAHAHEFIVEMPGAYDATLGEAGTGLSGGQRQRLALARAILRDPAILMLDEATSQVDTDSETRIAQALHGLRGGRTTFIIAHRMSTVRDADVVVVMDAGRIVDVGSHAELDQRCPTYRNLAASQLQPVAKE